ncbi:MAG: hypothetical protein R3B90_00435 [Planctomycetaceae bacterium]
MSKRSGISPHDGRFPFCLPVFDRGDQRKEFANLASKVRMAGDVLLDRRRLAATDRVQVIAGELLDRLA